MSNVKKILVTGAGGSAAANFIRSLKNNPDKEDLIVIGTDINQYQLELSEADKKYVVPKLTDFSYLATLNRLIEEEDIDYVHPQPDTEVAFLSEHRDELKTPLFLSKHKTVALCQNKMALNKFLQKKNIAVPEAYLIDDKESLNEAVETLLKKHDKLWLRAIQGAGSKASIPIINAKQAENWIEYWKEMKGLDYGNFMINEFLPGKEYAFQSVWKDGKILMSQARERREYVFGNLTVSGQSSSPSVAVTIHNQEVNNLGYEAVKAVDSQATGIFCIDMKTDSNEKIKLTEINIGRFFTTSYFFSKAGMNMPYYYIKLALGESIPSNIKPFNNVPENIFWIRTIDMGYKLIKGKKWTSVKL